MGPWSSKAWIIIDHLQGMIGLDTLAFWGGVPVAAEAAVSFQLVTSTYGGWVEGGKSPFLLLVVFVLYHVCAQQS